MPTSGVRYKIAFATSTVVSAAVEQLIVADGPNSTSQHAIPTYAYRDVFEYNGILWAYSDAFTRGDGAVLQWQKSALEFYRSTDRGVTWTKPFFMNSDGTGNTVFFYGYVPTVSVSTEDPSRLIVGFFLDPNPGLNIQQSTNGADYPFTFAVLHMDTGDLEFLNPSSGPGPDLLNMASRTATGGGVSVYYVADDVYDLAPGYENSGKIVVVARFLWFSPRANANHVVAWVYDLATNTWVAGETKISTDLPATIGSQGDPPAPIRDAYEAQWLAPFGNSTKAAIPWIQERFYANAVTDADEEYGLFKVRTLDLVDYSIGPIETLDSSSITNFAFLPDFVVIDGVFLLQQRRFINWVKVDTNTWWAGMQVREASKTSGLPTVVRVQLSGSTTTTDFFRISTSTSPIRAGENVWTQIDPRDGTVYCLASGTTNSTTGDLGEIVLYTCNPAAGNITFNAPVEYFSWLSGWNDTIMGGPIPSRPLGFFAFWPEMFTPRLLFMVVGGNYLDSASATAFCM